MTGRRGAALVVALFVVMIAGAVAASALGWAMLQLHAGRSWQAAAQREGDTESTAARWRAGDTTALVSTWIVTDTLVLVQVALAGTGLMELICWRDTLNPAGVLSPNCVPHRGFLRGPR